MTKKNIMNLKSLGAQLGAFLLFILATTQVYSQTDGSSQIIDKYMTYPPTPNMAALTDFNETQIDLFTGRPNISIPLYTVKQGDIKVPITINYSAGGIRVEEVATWVGLGWSLSCGGAISRTVQGIPDDYGNGYINAAYSVQDLLTLQLQDEANGTNLASSYYFQANNQEIDFDPDIFHINFPGFSGKFIWDQENIEFIQFPRTNNKIATISSTQPGDSEIKGWVITTDDGTKYYFGENESRTDTSGQEIIEATEDFSYTSEGYSDAGGTVGSYIGAWYLMEIVDINNKSIKFSYSKNQGVQQSLKTSESEIWPYCQASSYTISFSKRTYDEVIPHKIEFDYGKIVFYPDDEATRLDLKNSRALKRMEIQYPDGSLFKSFNFDYNYFTSYSSGVIDWPEAGDINERFKRLYLASIHEGDKNDVAKKPYIFSYNTDVILPDRFSCDQDLWGFYNDKGNLRLVPKIDIMPYVELGVADRSVNPGVSQACNLNKITYPTGGSEEFIYKQNQYNTIDGDETQVKMHKIMKPHIVASDIYSLFFHKNIADQIDPNTYEKEFIVHDGILDKVKFTMFNTSCLPNQPDECDYQITIQDVRGNMVETLDEEITNLYLEPGEYKITAQRITFTNPDHDFSVDIRYDYEIYDYSGTHSTGGLRIDTIITYDNTGNKQIKKYTYGNGILSHVPVHYTDYFINRSCDPSLFVNKLTSSSLNSHTYKGSHIGYNKVSEYKAFPDGVIGTSEEPGKKEYYFDPSFKEDNVYGLPITTPFYFDFWKQGNLSTIINYSKQNDVYEIVSKEFYLRDNFDSYEHYPAGVKLIPGISTPGGGSSAFVTLVAFYGQSTEWYRLNQKISELYYPNNTVINTTQYNYDYNPVIVSHEESANSRNENVETKYYYASNVGLFSDITGTDYSVIVEMVQPHNNMLKQPIQIEKYVGNELIEKQRILYKKFGNSEQVIKPYKIMTAYSNSEDFVTEIELLEYDEKGNLLYSIPRNGEKNCYLWSYNYSFPVAIIKGISYQEIELLLGGTATVQALSENTTTESINTTLLNLRNSLSSNKNVQITTVLYDMLKGAVNVTDPNGIKTEYSYDDFGRLYRVFDNDLNILKQYKYHYQNQQ